MQTSDEITPVTGELQVSSEIAPDTGELEAASLSNVSSRITDYRSAVRLRRLHMRQQPTTDALSLFHTETPTRATPRQVTQVREGNRHLRQVLEVQRAELAQVRDAYTQLQTRYEQDIAVIHSAHRQEIEAHLRQLQEVLDVHGSLQQQYQELEQRFHSLEQSLDTSAEQIALEKVAQAARELEASPEHTPVLLQAAIDTLQRRAKDQEDKHLVEILFLKREIQRMTEELEQKRVQVDAERQNLFAMQNSAREQAELREKWVQARLHARTRARVMVVSIGMLCLLVVLQFVCMRLFNITTTSGIFLALLAPILLCIMCSIILATPASMAKTIYQGAPHKRKVKNT